MLFDPGYPENRNYICQVACDIVRRYDVDGIHIDDYFYPYPVAGLAIPDDNSYALYGNGMDRAEWRRQNVNQFIQQMCYQIRSVKPWVKFGVSPFGIYRNQKNDPNGSATNGLQNYDDLYADVLTWVENGWVDYNLPQLYWEIGHKTADYETLINWWSAHAGKRPLYIGQDVMRTVKAPDPQNPSSHQMPRKYMLQRSLPGIFGSCQCMLLQYARIPVTIRLCFVRFITAHRLCSQGCLGLTIELLVSPERLRLSGQKMAPFSSGLLLRQRPLWTRLYSMLFTVS